MRVLGIDCGCEKAGYGVIDTDGRSHHLVIAGTVKMRPSDPLAKRLSELAVALRNLIETHRPDAAAVEDVFYALNAKSALKLAHARGVALLVIAEAGIGCGEYSPLTVKQSVVGSGRAEKRQVQFMVRSLLGGSVPVNEPDACDALAVAICHANVQSSAMALAVRQ